MNWLAAAGTSVWKEVSAHAQKREQGHYSMLAELGKDHRHAPVHLLEKAARALVVVLLSRYARPDPQTPPQEVTRRLRDVALLMMRLEQVSDAAYDLGLGQRGSGFDRPATVNDLMRRFEEECRGVTRGNAATLKRVHERFDENVGALFGLFRDLAATTKAWDMEACYDYQGRFELVVEAAMDAALTLEAHYESRVFGPPEDGDADLTRGLRPLVTGCAGPPPVDP